jgi:hypothetical protein
VSGLALLYTARIKFGITANFHVKIYISCKVAIYLFKTHTHTHTHTHTYTYTHTHTYTYTHTRARTLTHTHTHTHTHYHWFGVDNMTAQCSASAVCTWQSCLGTCTVYAWKLGNVLRINIVVTVPSFLNWWLCIKKIMMLMQSRHLVHKLTPPSWQYEQVSSVYNFLSFFHLCQ